MLKTALHFSHELLQGVVEPGDTVVDATVGNGFDTLFLAKLVGTSGKVIGFDIQKQAIDTTSEKLVAEKLDTQVQLFQKGHEQIADVLLPDTRIKAAIFNLGYLPKSDKHIITTAPTTIQALEWLLTHLEKKGRIILVIYYGHPGGLEEKETVLAFVKTIPQTTYNVLSYQFINQTNSPPLLVAIERKKEKNAR